MTTQQETRVERNKALVRRYWDENINQESQAVLAELLAPNFVHHVVGFPDAKPGPEGDREFIAMFKSAFRGSRVTIEEVIAEGDKVAVHLNFQNKHLGDFMGIPATGKDCPTNALSIARVEGGKLAAMYTVSDVLGILQQIGAVPALGQAKT